MERMVQALRERLRQLGGWQAKSCEKMYFQD
jgi:hypothetical protein